jgi:hypothetical protein
MKEASMSHFTINNLDGYVIIEFPKVIYKDEINDFSQTTMAIPSLGIHTVVFDLKNCEMLYSMVFPIVAMFKMNLKKNDINLYSINVSKEVSKIIHSGGVEGFFSILDNFRQVQEKVGFKTESRPVLETENLNFMFSAISTTFKSMYDVDTVRSKAQVKTGSFIQGVGVLCIVNLVETDILGAIKIYFPESVLFAIQRKKFQLEVGGMSQKLIADIELFGQNYFDLIQPFLAEQNFKLVKTFPTVLVGILSQMKQSNEVSMVMPFKTQYGEFWAEVSKA